MFAKKTLVVACAALILSACATSQPPQQTPEQQGEYSTLSLLQLMDKDQNGKVSRAEFMKFMSDEFDLLDTDKSGELDPTELANLGQIRIIHGTTSR